MKCEKVQSITGLQRCESIPAVDRRGSFQKIFGRSTTEIHLEHSNFVIRQVNVSITETIGTVRGLHMQLGNHQEGKIVFCLAGEIYDVVLDLREDSPTFLGWISLELAPTHGFGIRIPPGCAHGFQVLRGPATVLYLHDGDYVAEMDGGIDCMDQDVGLNWPLPVINRSSRDRALPSLTRFLSDRLLQR